MEMGGVFENLRSFFDVFKPKEKTGLPIPAEPSRLPIPRKAPPSGTPGRGLTQWAQKAFGAFKPGTSKGALTPWAEKTFGIYKPEAPSLPAPSRKKELFEALFPEEEASRGSMFESLRPSAIKPGAGPRYQDIGPVTPYRPPRSYRKKLEEWNRQFPDIAEETQGQIPTWIAHDFGWVMPSPAEVAEQISWSLGMDLNTAFEDVLSILDTPWWREEVRESPHTGLVATYELSDMSDEFLYKIMGLPEELYNMYGYNPLGDEYFWAEILIPYFRRFTKAMDALKPQSIPGWFEIVLGKKDFDLVYHETPRGGLWQ